VKKLSKAEKFVNSQTVDVSPGHKPHKLKMMRIPAKKSKSPLKKLIGF